MAPEPGTPGEWRAIITLFLHRHVERAGAEGVVLGMSGGVDSAVTAALCVEALGQERVFGVLMPHRASDPDDALLATAVCKRLGIASVTRDITPIVDALQEVLGTPPDERARGNAKARARMMCLYAEAQSRRLLVCGTGNKSELLVGYFTKWGDGGADLQPLGDLWKTQVWELARDFGLPPEVVLRAPSAGLRPGQTDEQDLGLAYRDLDRVLQCFERNEGVDEAARRTQVDRSHVERIERMVRHSEHKRHFPLVPKIGARTVGVDWRRPVHWDA